MESDSVYTESSTVTFEWTLRGLKNLFDSTKGDKKSKVTKSVRFGSNRWQVLFYANAGQAKEGTEGGGFVSLYLSCEPTLEEKESALGDSGRWVRDGVYKFSFELRSLGSPHLIYNSKEAQNHSFTWKTANWGWAQFARRDAVFYHSMPAKQHDAFLITCSITSSPTPPPTYAIPCQPVPKGLLDTFGALLDDPRYSDVQFIIPKRGQNISNGWKIWASKRILQRADYFQTMFNSNFVEGFNEPGSCGQTPKSMTKSLRRSPPQLNLLLDEFEDSDDDDDVDEHESPRPNEQSIFKPPGPIDANSILLSDSTHLTDWHRIDQEAGQSTDSHVPSPEVTSTPLNFNASQEDTTPSHPKMTIIVKDAAYSTYRAMLYYLYTDSIVFAPLSSSFLGSTNDTMERLSSGDVSIPSTPSEGSQVSGAKHLSPQDPCNSRAEWIKEWMKNNPDRPAPCSAKSIYRIADKLDLSELKERAAKFITKSLTVDNIAYEVFSPFAATFESIRKVEIEFFLSHWHEIRTSNTMKNVWVQIRNGRHPGFEDVWPLIVQNLDFKPSSPETSKTKNNESWQ